MSKKTRPKKYHEKGYDDGRARRAADKPHGMMNYFFEGRTLSGDEAAYREAYQEGKRARHGTAAVSSDVGFRHEEIMGGIAAHRVKELIDHGTLGAKHVYRVIPQRTFSRRLAKDEPLKIAEGDAIARLVRVTNAARATFGEAEFANKWLNAANPALRDQVPIEMAATDAGAREVETVLSRIAYGDYS